MQKFILSRKYFKLVFILYGYINTLALGYLGIENNILAIFIIMWATIILINDLIHKEIAINKDMILINCYGIILLFATLANQKYSDFKSYLLALMQIIIFALVFATKKSTTITDIKAEIKLIVPFTNFIVALASGTSLIMYLLNIYDTKNGWLLGVSGGRLFGVYFNCNPAAILACITILLAIIAITHKFKYQKLYYLNIGIQFMYIVLTKSRSALIVLAMIITALSYYYFIKKKNSGKVKKILILCSISVLTIFSSLLLDKAISAIFNNQDKVQEESRFQFGKLIEATNSLLTGDPSKAIELIDQVSSGRLELMNTSLKVWQTSPIIGIGANNFRKMGMTLTDDQTIQSIQVVHSHNEFIEAFVTTGIIGGTIFIIFFISSFKKALKILKIHYHSTKYFTLLIFALIVSCEIIGGLFDYGVFYVYSLSSMIAWNFLGYLHWAININKNRIK